MTPKLEERAVVIALGGGTLALEGIYLTGAGPDAGGAVIAAPHPLYGGSMESPVVNEIAYACQRAGLASLCFNWRGVGASAGEPSGEAADADADYAAAALHLEETVSGPLVAAGYSFGAAAALRVGAQHPRVRRLLLVSPPPSLLVAAALEGFRGAVLMLTGEHDAIAPARALEDLAASLPWATLRVVADADHFFMAGLGEIARAVGDWL
ncbi:MAG: alpha/beta fold hydrolase [Deltaproteobacteria bacterium]|nr:alpha/beta fold hydrolase [Deltaproteobacteria bacterium]